MEQKRITILGSTGSIGTQALQVGPPLGVPVEAISANTSIDLQSSRLGFFAPLCGDDGPAGGGGLKNPAG